MRDIKGTHELTSNTRWRGKGNEVQEAVQPHNKKDHARQISGDYESGSHNPVLLFDQRHCIGVMYIDVNRIDAVYFSEIQVFYDPSQSRDRPPLDSNDEGDARPDKVRSRRY